MAAILPVVLLVIYLSMFMVGPQADHSSMLLAMEQRMPPVRHRQIQLADLLVILPDIALDVLRSPPHPVYLAIQKVLPWLTLRSFPLNTIPSGLQAAALFPQPDTQMLIPLVGLLDQVLLHLPDTYQDIHPFQLRQPSHNLRRSLI